MTEVAPGHGARSIVRELGSGRTELRFDWDLGGTNRDEVTGNRDHVRGRRDLRDRRGSAALGAGRLHERDGAAARERRLGRALRDAHRDDVRRRALPDRVRGCACSMAARRPTLAAGRSRSRARAARRARRRAARRARPAACLPRRLLDAELGRAVPSVVRSGVSLISQDSANGMIAIAIPHRNTPCRAWRRPRGTRCASSAAGVRPRRD